MYKVRNETKKLPKKVNSNLSLYEACSRIENVKNGIVLNWENKLVSFWCSYYNKISIGYGATQFEKNQINNFFNNGVSK